MDPRLRLTCYAVDGPPVSHQRIPHIVDDEGFPAGVLDPLDPHTLLTRINSSFALRHMSRTIAISEPEAEPSEGPLSVMPKGSST